LPLRAEAGFLAGMAEDGCLVEVVRWREAVRPTALKRARTAPALLDAGAGAARAHTSQRALRRLLAPRLDGQSHSRQR
jgi:hypothetical protein